MLALKSRHHLDNLSISNVELLVMKKGNNIPAQQEALEE